MAGHPEKRVSWFGVNDSPPGEDIPPPKKFVQIAILTKSAQCGIIERPDDARLQLHRAEFQIYTKFTNFLLDFLHYAQMFFNPKKNY